MSNIAIYVVGDKIGDAISKYPAIKAFKQALPVSSKIIWITGNEPSALVDQLSFLNRGIIDHFYIKNDFMPDKEKRAIFEQHRIQCLINTESRIKTGIKLRKLHRGLYICPSLNYFFSGIKPKTQNNKGSIFNRFYSMLSLAIKKELKNQVITLIQKAQTLLQKSLQYSHFELLEDKSSSVSFAQSRDQTLDLIQPLSLLDRVGAPYPKDLAQD